MSLAEIIVVDADASSRSSLSLFALCNRIAASSASNTSICINLIDPPTLYEATVSSCEKPRALDCSGVEYVEIIEAALCFMTHDTSRFELKWSRKHSALTLMERAEFAMKFCTIQFQVRDGSDKWCALLHQVAVQQEKNTKVINDKSNRIIDLEKLLGDKEALVETALIAKQSTEDRLIQGFCAVLNAKKDEIRRLQHEVEQAQRYDVATVSKKKPVIKNRRKASGAKLKRKKEETESDEKSDEHTDLDDEGDNRMRMKRDAVSAYSQLPSHLKSESMHISSADDLLSSMDDLIKHEEKVDEETQRGDTNMMKFEPVTTVSNQEKAKPTKKIQAGEEANQSARVEEAMDSEEEEILDMLS
ncbi:DNA repair protein XRCC4, C-terminal [Plasmopara halstedii]|uniref:DNA repair protein XRCC4, C-terminal n=1 Tax=Plasmopara halstedii TaxID=4781 RepID=A0A0N7L5T7_PLAHL|nr:DNA repair protein XRCC4, C-terminal [Plasmopara halstedii]CEG42387.1 DNA repair protein XRCC4, C-terminal [Plasmopara halstedii]|eukprot:XP_024578756.1 DNA repair protein XRCC4, C-terminal [Plasmopara halstedii]